VLVFVVCPSATDGAHTIASPQAKVTVSR
jgi:hypothetical protein